MHYPEILRVLTQEPLAIAPSAHAAWLDRYKAFLNWREVAVEREPGQGPSGSVIQREQSQIVEGIYYLPVGGPVGRGLGKVEKGAGCVDYAEIIADLDEFAAKDEARACIMDWDCPGGMVQGGLAVEQRILALDKPIYSFSAGLMASMAYKLACCTDGIFATADAQIGCIGVYCYLLDTSELYKAEGVKPVLITSGKYKGMGAPGLSLTTDQLSLLQDRIDESAANFYNHVDEMRNGLVSRDDMQGQTFTGEKALANGLIDGVVGGIEDVAAML